MELQMTRTKRLALSLAVFATASSMWATSFILPDDTTFVAKAHGIVIGTVEGSYVNTSGSDAPIETVYELRLERVLKGRFDMDELLRIVSPGGETDRYGVYVPGAASFANGQRVLLFLTRHKDHWEATDMMLGEFSFMTASHGEHVLVRGHDSVDDREAKAMGAVDKIRSEEGFLHFIEKSLEGRPVTHDYFFDPEAMAPKAIGANAFLRPVTNTFSDFTYTQVGGGPGGVRWQTVDIAAGLNYSRHTGCSGCDPANADTFITSGMGAWNNDCGSSVNLVLAGTTATAALNGVAGCGNICDFTNVIEWGDPNGHIAGSWIGSGTIGVTTIVYSNTANSAGTNFREIFDADIIFQDGYNPNTESSAAQATTHELGHSIGWRHSQAASSTPNGTTENCVPLSEDCAGGGYGGNAIMYYLATSLGYTLQTWDQNAIRAVYPNAGCGGTPPSAPTNLAAAATSTTSISLTWTASSTGTAPINYQVQRSSSGLSFSNVGAPTTMTNFTDPVSASPAAYLYRVVASNTAGTANSSPDLATNVIFIDDPLVAGTTIVQALHVTQLRTAVNAVQTLAGQANSAYTDNALAAGFTISAVHVTELRSRLQTARTALGLSTSYAEAITAGSTSVKASHFTELRDFVK
jgi:hypothetical protein